MLQTFTNDFRIGIAFGDFGCYEVRHQILLSAFGQVRHAATNYPRIVRLVVLRFRFDERQQFTKYGISIIEPFRLIEKAAESVEIGWMVLLEICVRFARLNRLTEKRFSVLAYFRTILVEKRHRA